MGSSRCRRGPQFGRAPGGPALPAPSLAALALSLGPQYGCVPGGPPTCFDMPPAPGSTLKFWPVWSYLAGTPWGHARAKPEDVLTLVQVVTSASTLPLSARRGGTARAPLSTIPLFGPYLRLPHTVLHSRLFRTPRRGRGPLSGTAALRAGLPPQCQRTQLVAVAPAEVAPWRRASNAIPPAGGTFGNMVSAAPPGNVQPGGR